MRPAPRSYRNRSAEQRRDERRTRLLTAALDIWGEHGWAAVTMRGVCARAELTNRYFYENFSDRDALLAAVWDQALGEAITVVLDAVAAAPPTPHAQLRAAVAAFIHAVAADPRKARIGFGEHAGSPILEQRRRDATHTFTTLMIEHARQFSGPHDTDDTALQITGMLAIGGLTAVITNWLNGSLPITAKQLIDHVTAIGMTVATPILTPGQVSE